MRGGGGRRRVRRAGRQARPRRRRPGEGRQRQPCVRAGSEAAPSPRGPRRRRRRRGRRGGSPEGEEDAGAAPKGAGHPLHALRPQGGAGPRRPSPSTGLGPGNAWNRGVRSGSMARPTSQRTRPPEASGTTTIPANRSAPRSMNRPQSWSRSAEKPSDSRASRSPLPGA